jgi:hypothetical protein|tara:strand:+ start:12287 stop:13453 length:1167 start_codon:yes stop_codon:yes gene_type:complete
MSEELEQKTPVVEEVKTEEPKPVSVDDGIIKVDLRSLNKEEENTIPEQEIIAEEVDQPVAVIEEVAEEVPQQQEVVQAEESFIEEITDEEVAEAVEELEEQVEQAIVEKDLGIELPENLQKAVDFMNETGGSLQDYVKLNTDYSALNETQLLREFYEATKPHLDREEIDFIMEDNFAYDEEVDEDRDIRRKKLARKEELAKAKGHLNGLKSKYYEEIKAGSNLNPETKKAVDFFNRYKKESEEASKVTENQVSTFNSKTEKLFSNDFKGFDFNVGEKKFRYKVKNADQVKDSQGDINNFVKKFLNDKNEMSDAAGYHKSLFTAMNADAIANHFYEQGKTDAMKSSVQRSKNIDMDPRGVHENVKTSSGTTFKSIQSTGPSKFGVKTRN